MPVSIKHLSAMIAEPPSLDPKHVTLMAEWHRDKLYYQVQLEKVDEAKNKSYVRFEDDTAHWICNLDLHLQFDAEFADKFQDEDIICCICDDGKSEKPNEIVICDNCAQAYHQECHQPPLLGMNLDENEYWACDTCKHILAQEQPGLAQQPPVPAPKPTKENSKVPNGVSTNGVASKGESAKTETNKAHTAKAETTKAETTNTETTKAVITEAESTTAEPTDGDTTETADETVVTNEFVKVLTPSSEDKITEKETAKSSSKKTPKKVAKNPIKKTSRKGPKQLVVRLPTPA